MMDFARKGMKTPTHKINIYLIKLGAGGEFEVLASRADRKGSAQLKIDPSDISFVRERLDGFLPEAIFMQNGNGSAIVVPAVYPVCGAFELLTFEVKPEKVMPLVKNGFFGPAVYREGFDDADICTASSAERDMLLGVANHARLMMKNRAVAESTDAISECARLRGLIDCTADFFGVEIDVLSQAMHGQISNCDRAMVSAFTVFALLFVRCRAKRRHAKLELSSDASKLWIRLEADCLDGTTFDEFEPLRQSTLIRDGCIRTTNTRGYIKVELCAYRADVSLIGLKQDPKIK